MNPDLDHAMSVLTYTAYSTPAVPIPASFHLTLSANPRHVSYRNPSRRRATIGHDLPLLGRVVLSTTNRINIKDGGASINSSNRSSNMNIIGTIDSINCRSNINGTNSSSSSGNAGFGSSKDSCGSRLQRWQGVLGGNMSEERPRQEREWQNGEGGAGDGVSVEFDDTILLKMGLVEPQTNVYGECRFKVRSRSFATGASGGRGVCKGYVGLTRAPQVEK